MRYVTPDHMIEDVHTLTTAKTLEEIRNILKQFGDEILADYSGDPAADAKITPLETDGDYAVGITGKICHGMRTPCWTLRIKVSDAGDQRIVETTAVGDEVEVSEGQSWQIKDSIRRRDQLEEMINA